jgi:hypothetical protein
MKLDQKDAQEFGTKDTDLGAGYTQESRASSLP